MQVKYHVADRRARLSAGLGVAPHEGDKAWVLLTTKEQQGIRTDWTSFSECILVYPAIFHDDEQVLGRILD